MLQELADAQADLAKLSKLTVGFSVRLLAGTDKYLNACSSRAISAEGGCVLFVAVPQVDKALDEAGKSTAPGKVRSDLYAGILACYQH